MTEESEAEEGNYWAGFSPFCLQAALPSESSPLATLRLRWIRVYWWLLLLVCYSCLLLQSNSNRELSSAVRYEIMEQLFPDWNKAAERTRDAELSPSLKELLDADDVAATLAFYNDICATQASVAGSIKDTWECKLFDIRVNKLEGADWDPTTNRALPNVDKDAEMNGTRGILESKAGQNRSNQEQAMQRRHEVKQICSENFFGTHFVIGDDPRKVPLGNVTAFSEHVQEVSPGLAADYDADLLHDRGLGPVKDDLNRIEMEVKQIKQEEHHVDQGLRQLQLSTRMNKRLKSLGLLDVDKPDPVEAATLNETSGAAQAVKEEKYLGSGCFDPGDVAGLLRDLWVSHAGSTDGEKMSLNEEKAKALIKDVLPNTTSDTWATVVAGVES